MFPLTGDYVFKKCIPFVILFFLANVAFPANELTTIEKNSIERIEVHDQIYMKQKGPSFFKQLSMGQTPMFTILTCSDSRVQTEVFDDNPEGNFFMVRNIGNQLKTSMGSVDYGVSYLNTKILLIIGHSKCGAIEAIRKGHYKRLKTDVVKELNAIPIRPGISNISGVVQNVDYQIDEALKQYAQKIKNHQLVVVGAVYDFADEMNKGAGELLIININGETNPTKLKKIIGPTLNN